jgi:hypothetical protein
MGVFELIFGIVPIVVIVIVVMATSVRILRDYERAVIFRFGLHPVFSVQAQHRVSHRRGDTPPPMPFPPSRSRHTIPAVTWQPLP